MISKKTLPRILRNFLGFDIVRYSASVHPLARRALLLKNYGVDMVLDVGASAGYFGQQLRSIGYRGRILSFEPLSSAYATLLQTIGTDLTWTAHNFALGSMAATATINIAKNSYSSSLNQMLPAHLKAAPWSEFIGTEQVEVKTLDSIFAEVAALRHNILLKIDTQGSELEVLKGATSTLPKIGTIQLEMSLVPLYENDVLFPDMHKYLCEMGYELVGMEPGFTDRTTGRLLQLDGIFHRL